PYNAVADLKKAQQPLKLAGAGVGSASTNDEKLLSEILGIPVQIVNGYTGQQADLAMQRGEIDGQVGALSSLHYLVDNGAAKYILGWGASVPPGVEDLSKVAPASAKALVSLMMPMAVLERLFAATPDIPPERAEALRQAFAKALADPELQAKAKQAKLPVDYTSGQDVAKMINEALAQPPENVQKLTSIVNGK
ncbi:MAG: hypothetical protein K6T31_06935, partial [Alicyclobacillus sp.]|nr:hypothetical protein [Alicyclobacillus sp.]